MISGLLKITEEEDNNLIKLYISTKYLIKIRIPDYILVILPFTKN